jgi:hypothetical protein
MLHDDVQARLAVELAAAGCKQANQMRVLELAGRVPLGQQRVRRCWCSGYELDRNLGGIHSAQLGEKNGAVVRAADPALQRKNAVYDVPLPLRPELTH